ncbi:hypothetical protein F4861DRAFT_516769 [Xylaria intraflava]|nr:hypothetical protein F4861DRAFT_516769 [Xylaria intraflava]
MVGVLGRTVPGVFRPDVPKSTTCPHSIAGTVIGTPALPPPHRLLAPRPMYRAGTGLVPAAGVRPRLLQSLSSPSIYLLYMCTTCLPCTPRIITLNLNQLASLHVLFHVRPGQPVLLPGRVKVHEPFRFCSSQPRYVCTRRSISPLLRTPHLARVGSSSRPSSPLACSQSPSTGQSTHSYILNFIPKQKKRNSAPERVAGPTSAHPPDTMPSPRRVRLLMITVFAIVFTVLFFTSRMRHSTPRDPRTINSFFGKTMEGLDQRHGTGGQIVAGGKGSAADTNLKDHDGDGSVDEDDEILARKMAERLRAAEQQAKDQANAKAPLKPDAPSEVVGVGSSAGGQAKGKNRISKQEAKEEEQQDDETDAVDEDSDVEVTLRQILKKSPVVIFSKTYCSFSKRAKGILLDKYTIEPTPYVVELNEHPLGRKLQALLADKTGRTTVPNILINGQSVGGSDDIMELDARKTLIDKFKSMGGKKLSMKERFAGNVKDQPL